MFTMRNILMVAAGFAAGYFVAKNGVPGLPA